MAKHFKNYAEAESEAFQAKAELTLWRQVAYDRAHGKIDGTLYHDGIVSEYGEETPIRLKAVLFRALGPVDGIIEVTSQFDGEIEVFVRELRDFQRYWSEQASHKNPLYPAMLTLLNKLLNRRSQLLEEHEEARNSV